MSLRSLIRKPEIFFSTLPMAGVQHDGCYGPFQSSHPTKPYHDMMVLNTNLYFVLASMFFDIQSLYIHLYTGTLVMS